MNMDVAMGTSYTKKIKYNMCIVFDKKYNRFEEENNKTMPYC